MMKRTRFNFQKAFTLVELLVVIGIIAILAALFLPVLKSGEGKSKRTVCLGNLKQLALGIHMYVDDNGSAGNPAVTNSPFLSFTNYRELINNYVGVKGAPSPQDRIFACPADRFFYDLSRNGRGYVAEPLHEQAEHAFTSYAFNAGEFTTPPGTNAPATTNHYGLAGQKLDLILHPTTTVLLAEMPAFLPYSWHEPKVPLSTDNAKFNDAKDVIGFVDGHASYLKIYFDGTKTAWAYNPPAGYDYQWSGD